MRKALISESLIKAVCYEVAQWSSKTEFCLRLNFGHKHLFVHVNEFDILYYIYS